MLVTHTMLCLVEQIAIQYLNLIPHTPSPFAKLQFLAISLKSIVACAQQYYDGLIPKEKLQL